MGRLLLPDVGVCAQSCPHFPPEVQAWRAFFWEPDSSPSHRPPSMGLQQFAPPPQGAHCTTVTSGPKLGEQALTPPSFLSHPSLLSCFI